MRFWACNAQGHVEINSFYYLKRVKNLPALLLKIFEVLPKKIECSLKIKNRNVFDPNLSETLMHCFRISNCLFQNITARRNPNFYNITNSKGKVARFCLFKQAYKLGEDIIGTFDFSEASVPCVQVSIQLTITNWTSESLILLNNNHQAPITSSGTYLILFSWVDNPYRLLTARRIGTL